MALLFILAKSFGLDQFHRYFRCSSLKIQHDILPRNVFVTYVAPLIFTLLVSVVSYLVLTSGYIIVALLIQGY